MSITRKLMSVSTPTMPTDPIDLSWLTAYSSRLPFGSSQFGLLFRFQKGCDDWLDGHQGSAFDSLLHFLQHLCTLLTLEFPLRKLYTHKTEDSLWQFLC